jgi:glycosyltransferase involved in cell wall biosynthesis
MTNCLSDVRLILFFTRGVSLRTWDQVGALEREVEIYRRLLPHLRHVAFLTYGDRSELQYAPSLGDIEILYNRWGLPVQRYARLAPVLHWRQMWQADIFKTNQTEGSEVALKAKQLFGKKVVARAGFMWSFFFKAAGTFSYDVESLTRHEREAFTRSDRVVVTTTLMKEHAVEHYGLPPAKVWVIPNYVLTDLFKPLKESCRPNRRIIYVGRLSQEKNLLGLLQAIRGLNVELILIGNGPQRQHLEKRATTCGINVRFLGNQPHYELPKFLNQADLFVLPSYSEGHPKAMLEAMACGLPVIGANVPGIRELIEHRQTGFLCGPSADEIRAAILEVLSNDRLRAKMGRLARDFVIEKFSIDKILELELNLLRSFVTDG